MKKILSLLIMLSFVQNCFATDTRYLRIHGSNTVGANLAPELVKLWLTKKGLILLSDEVTAKEERLIIAANKTQHIEVEIYAHGSSTSFRDFAAGKTDIGIASRPIKDKEVKALHSLGDLRSKQSEFVLALDGLPIIVHPSNPLTQLDVKTVRKIFSGKISRWSQLGIKFKGKIKVYARDNNSGTYDTFKSLVLGKKSPLVKTAKRFESNTLLSDSVSNDPNGIGFVGLAYVRKTKVLAISDDQTDAIKPAAFSVATEDYALARRLFLYIPENNPKPLAKEFAHFAISTAADEVVTQVGFVSQKINRYQPAISHKAPDEYRKLIRGAERLSLNIRFNSGSIVPDNKALQNIKRLANYLSKPENKKRHIMLFGFADKNEVAPFFSLSVSVQRADIVANHLLKLHVAPFRVRGYGQQRPVANNSTKQGRHKNRRVEVWLM